MAHPQRSTTTMTTTTVTLGAVIALAGSATAAEPTTRPPRCSGQAWTYAGGSRDAGAGQVYTTVRLKNTSGRICAVRGYATLRLIGATGKVLGPTTPDGTTTRIIVVPRGGTVHLVLHTSNPGVAGPAQCQGPSQTLVLTPPDTHQVLRIHVPGLSICHGHSGETPFRPGP
jgi:hypothetical protein